MPVKISIEEPIEVQIKISAETDIVTQVPVVTPITVTTVAIFKQLNKPSVYKPGKVKIIEFFRFDCGHCYSLNQEMPNLKKKYGDKIEITYIPMLWRTISTDDAFMKSIEAYIIANDMGKGDEMKDALFKAVFIDDKDISNLFILEDIGRDVGLNSDFIVALKNGDVRNRATANIRLAEDFQIDETPTIIVNGNLKITQSMTGETISQMVKNIDVVIGSFLN